MTDADNIWTAAAQRPGVGAHTYTEATYDYLHMTLGRDGYDNSNGLMMATIANGNCTDNAYWNGTQVTFCAPGGGHTSLACGADVVGHEWGHGVTDTESNLVNSCEPGALGESFSDMLGISIGFSSDFDPDWVMGEVKDGLGFRDISDPPRFQDPDCVGGANWVRTEGCWPDDNNDHCGIHTNCGVPNKMFYFLSQGGSAHGHTVTAIGRDEAMRVMYRANRDYWSPTTNFLQAKQLSVQAAQDINPNYATPTREAWYAVCVEAPDLVIDHIDPDESVSPVRATVYVKNQGLSTAGATWTRVKVDGRTKCSAIDTGSIEAGETRSVTCDLGSLSVGNHDIRATADVTNRVYEENESNNSKTESVWVWNWPLVREAVVVHTNDQILYSTDSCDRFQFDVPQICEGLNTQTDKPPEMPSVVWFILAFLTGNNPGVTGIQFGNSHNLPDGSHAHYGSCGPVAAEIPGGGWPDAPQGGTSITYSAPVFGDFLPIYYFDVYGSEGAYYGSGIHPEFGHAAYADNQFPPVLHEIEHFGQVRWYEPGFNECPTEGGEEPSPGACCFEDGSCVPAWDLDECLTMGGVDWLGLSTPCEPNPCAQPGACCFTDGRCQIMTGSDCVDAQGTWHDDWGACDPNPCPQPACLAEVTETGVSYPVVIRQATKNGLPLDVGDQIRLYAGYQGGEIAVGSVVFEGSYGDSILAWAKVKDPPLPGFTCGEPILMCLCVGSTGEQLCGTPTWETGGHYCEGDVSVATLVAFDSCQHWANHDVGNCVLTVTDQGILGFPDATQTAGSGFIYPADGANTLYIGGLWVGQDTTYVASRDYDADPEKEWAVSWAPPGYIQKDETGWIQGYADSDQDIYAKYRDRDAAEPRGLLVDQESWAYSTPDPPADLIIVRYTVRNTGDARLSGLHVGVFLDYDIADAGYNTGSTDRDRELVYMTDPSGVHVGLRLLQDESGEPALANLTLIHNPTYVYPNEYILDADKYKFLSAADPQHVVGDAPDPADWSVLASAGPFDLDIDEERLVCFAIIGGRSLQELLTNADVAEVIYQKGITGTPPVDLLPEATRLMPNVPNPFGRATVIQFSLVQESNVNLSVYDVRGRLVKKLAAGQLPAKWYTLTWDGRDDDDRTVPAGVYLLRLDTGQIQESRRLIRLK